jgi:nucleoside-diphosphate-sugar epimerase
MSHAADPAGQFIVVTGAGGFVGQRLVRALCARGDAVIGVGRGAAPANWPQAARWVRADIADPPAYEDALANAACVIHLAAITGKATRAEFRRANVDATKALIDASIRAGARRFIFVSSVAVTFKDRRYYPYADSKIAAEALVRAAPIASAIVRPTMILGPGSPIETALAKLAMLPVAPLFGEGKRIVQPIDVDDVVIALTALAHDDAAGVIEIGGPETYDLRGLYARLRAVRGKPGAPRFAHIPLALARHALAAVEGPLLPLLPLTAGQLATFVNDGVAAPSPAAQRALPAPRTTPRTAPAAPDAPGGPPPGALEAEFNRHARYIVGAAPTPYQIEKYLDFHRRKPLAPRGAMDALILRLSRFGRLGLALADSYSGLFFRTAVLRAKLVLALAILETSAPSYAALDAPEPGGRLVYARMAMRGGLAALSTAAAALFLLPAHILLGGRGRTPSP